MRPLQRQNFAQTRTGEYKKPERQNCEQPGTSIGFHPIKDIAQLSKFIQTQKSLLFQRPELFDPTAWIGVIRPVTNVFLVTQPRAQFLARFGALARPVRRSIRGG